MSIGPNAIVGAGSVITRDVFPGTVVAGNPAVVIGSFENIFKRRREKFCNKDELSNEEVWDIFYKS